MNVTAARVLSLIAVGTISAALADPVIEANRPTMDFGDWIRSDNTEIQYALWIYNRGSTDLHIGVLGGGNPIERPFSISDIFDDCTGQTLTPSGHCEVTIVFEPRVIGTLVGDFDIASDDPNQPALTITVRGRVATDFLDGRLDGIAKPATLSCKNLTTGQVVRQRLVGDATTSNPTTWDCLHAGFVASHNDRIEVLIRGPAEADTLEGEMAHGMSSRGLGHVHILAPDLVVTPAIVDFGRVSTLDADRSVGVIIGNDNDVPVHFTEIGTTNRLAEPFFVEIDRLSHSDCPPNTEECVGPDGYFGLFIGMRVTEGVFSDSFSITSNDPLRPVTTVPVVGEGVPDMVNATIVGETGSFNVTCQNLTTGQRFVLSNRWDCWQMGLRASAGDEILTSFSGRKN